MFEIMTALSLSRSFRGDTFIAVFITMSAMNTLTKSPIAGRKPITELQPDRIPHMLIALASGYARRLTLVRTLASALGIWG